MTSANLKFFILYNNLRKKKLDFRPKKGTTVFPLILGKKTTSQDLFIKLLKAILATKRSKFTKSLFQQSSK